MACVLGLFYKFYSSPDDCRCVEVTVFQKCLLWPVFNKKIRVAKRAGLDVIEFPPTEKFQD